MGNGKIRQGVAAASATAMVGAALAVGGAGAASAEPVSASGSKEGVSYNRTVSDDAPVWGEEISITNRVTRGSNLWMVYWIEDVKPACLEYVPGSTTWTVSGKTYTQASNPNEVYVTDTSTKIDPPLADSWTPPIDFTAKYRVLCDAGKLNTGGPKWETTWVAGAADFSSNGPSINVRRAYTSLFLQAVGNPQLGDSVSLRVDAPEVPNGGVVTFTADGAAIGTGVVNDGQATAQWTPSTTGTKQIAASFAQTGSHLAAVSNVRSITISARNEASTVTLDVAGTPKVGAQTQITADVSPTGAGGTVDFKVGNVVIDTVEVGSDGKASTTWIPATAGPASIDASFSGRPGVNPSDAPGIPVDVAPADVNQVATTTTLDKVAPTPLGSSIVLRAQVDLDTGGGSITFYDGQSAIATVPVGADGVATFEWRPDSEGERTVRAIFSGNGAYLASQALPTQVIITPKVVDPDPDPDPTDPATGSLGSLTDSLGGGAGGAGSLSSLGS